MPLISPALMRQLIALDESAMPHSANVSRPSTTGGTNDRGKVTRGSLEPVGSAPCRLTLGASQTEAENLVGGVGVDADATISFPLGALTVQEEDVIDFFYSPDWEGLGSESSVRYNVVGVGAVGSYSTNLTVYVKAA